MENKQNLDGLFNTAKKYETVYSFDETKQTFLENVTASPAAKNPKNNFFSSLKNWIIMVTIASTFFVFISLWMYNSDSGNELPTQRENEIKKTISKERTEKSIQTEKINLSETKAENLISSKKHGENVNENLHENKVEISLKAIKKENATISEKNHFPTEFKEEYIFPKLTEKEISATNKQKKAMVKALSKMDSKTYTFLTSGNVSAETGKLTSVQAYLIQKTEVSNLEYRTFLFDLLIQGRKEEFLKAKPDQAKWLLVDNAFLVENYFSNEEFNKYPVVNISIEGAELYCNWLTTEVFKTLSEQKKRYFTRLRLPTRTEWIMAASIEGKKGPFPWDNETTQDEKGNYLANFKPLAGEDSLSYAADGTKFTDKVDSYPPNDFGLYNMSGNVAEMVYNDQKTRALGTSGGSWNSSEEELKKHGPDLFSGKVEAHPTIGFRVVMSIIVSKAP